MGLYTTPPSPGVPPPPLFGPAERQQSPYMQTWMLPLDALGEITGMTGKLQAAQAGVPRGPAPPGGGGDILTPRRQPLGNIGAAAPKATP